MGKMGKLWTLSVILKSGFGIPKDLYKKNSELIPGDFSFFYFLKIKGSQHYQNLMKHNLDCLHHIGRYHARYYIVRYENNGGKS